MSTVNWLKQHVSDLPPGNRWLSEGEVSHLGVLRIEKRRNEWKLGRWTAKRAIAAFFDIAATPGNLAGIELIPGLDGAPVAHVNGAAAAVAVSISHCDGTGMCAVTASGRPVGCDIERIERHSDRFIADYFTEEEQHLIGCSNDLVPSLLWSAKESVLKLLHTGLRLDTRSVSVTLSNTGAEQEWHGFRATFLGEMTFRGWWRISEALVSTVSTFPPSATAPELLTGGLVNDMADHILPCRGMNAGKVCGCSFR